jgi:hypothetical protein
LTTTNSSKSQQTVTGTTKTYGQKIKVNCDEIITPTFCGDSIGLKKIHEWFAGHSIRGWACKGAAQGKDGKETCCQNFHLK